MPRSPDDPATGGGDEYVAVDLETTGLDPAADRIIEIGAVRFGAEGPRERFRTFVSPGRPLPPAIRMLTKIEDADLVGAPPPSLAVHEFAAFARGLPLVAHNAPFDLGFLAEAGLQPQAPAYDSYDFASVLLPTATRLDLSSLAGSLGVEISEAHRALADAEATAEVFLRLLERLERLPAATLRDLVRLAEQSAWSLAPLFAGALDRRGIEAASEALAPGGLAREPQALPPPLRALREFTPLDGDEVEARFAEARRRADLLPGFEAREGQIAMARAVTANIAHDGQLAVEAGTGTGKSLAYLVPALSHALRSDERVVISTHTLNLQEQLAEREMPAAAALAESAAGARPGSLRTAVLKGRGNYLCLERWSQAIESEEPRSAGQARVLARIAVWLGETERGDRAELYLRGDEGPHWRALAADTNDCLQRRCAFVREGSCFLQRARAEAAAAHVLVVNHALLLVNATGGDQLLPPFRHLVVDEAHRLEGVATSQFGDSVALHEIAQLLDEVTAGGGSLAASLRGAARLDPMPLSPAAGLAHLADEIASAAVMARARLPDLEAAIAGYVEEFAGRARGSQLQITPGRRAQPLWGDVEDGALHLELALDQLARRLLHAQSMVDSLPTDGAPALATLRAALARAAGTAAGQAATLRDALQRADPGRIVWLDSSGRSPRVRTAPLDVADRLEDELWARRDSVLVTSATLTAQQRFDFSLRRIGLPDADVLDVGSPVRLPARGAHAGRRRSSAAGRSGLRGGGAVGAGGGGARGGRAHAGALHLARRDPLRRGRAARPARQRRHRRARARSRRRPGATAACPRGAPSLTRARHRRVLGGRRCARPGALAARARAAALPGADRSRPRRPRSASRGRVRRVHAAAGRAALPPGLRPPDPRPAGPRRVPDPRPARQRPRLRRGLPRCAARVRAAQARRERGPRGRRRLARRGAPCLSRAACGRDRASGRAARASH